MKRFRIAVIVEIDAEDEDDAIRRGMAIGDAGHFDDPSGDLTTLEVWPSPVGAGTALLGEIKRTS